MRRLFRLLPIAMLLLAAFPAFAQLAAVTGTVTDAGGVGVPNAYLQFDLYGCGGNRPRWTGGVVSSSVQLYGDANGAVTGNVVRNDQITCANTVGNTTYFVQQFINGQPSGPRLQYQINAATFNWNTQVAITQAPVVTPPNGDTVYARLDGGNMPFTGPVEACGTTLNGVHWVCDLTSGADLGAKINTAAASGGIVAISPGMVATSISTALSLPAGTALYFPSGTFTSSVPLVFAVDKVKIHGFGKGITVLQYTGGAVSSFVKFGTATPTVNQLLEVSLEDMTIKGSANVTDTVFITGVHHSLFRNLDLKDATQACFHSQFAVSPELENIRCSLNSGAFVQQPAIGLFLDSIDINHFTTSCTITDPIIEGVSGSGIKFGGVEGCVVTGGTSEQNNRGIETTTAAFRNTFIGVDMEGNATEDILENGQNNAYISSYSLKLAHIGAASVNAVLKYGELNSIQIDSGAIKAKVEDLYYNINTGTITDNAQETEWKGIVNAFTNLQTSPTGSTGWFFRHTIPQVATSSLGTIDRQDFLRGTFDIPNTGKIISTSAEGTTPWRVIFIGAWMNNFEGAGLTQPALMTECTTAAPTVVVGSVTVTCSKNGSNQLVLTSNANVATFTGSIFVTTMTIGVAGTKSAEFKGSVTAPGLPQVIASGTAVMTTAGIATGACGTTVTVAGTGILTTDTIDISHNAAVTIGNGGGLTLNFWPTAGNVNFNYCNSAAGTITPTAMTVNWAVRR